MFADWLKNHWYVPTIIIVFALVLLGLYGYKRYQNKGKRKSPMNQKHEEEIRRFRDESRNKQELKEKLLEQQKVLEDLFEDFQHEGMDGLLSTNQNCLESLESGDYKTILNEYNCINDEIERINHMLDGSLQDSALAIQDLEENFMDKIINHFGWTKEELSEYYNNLENGIIKKNEAELKNEEYGYDIIQQIYEILPKDFSLPNEQALNDWWYDDVLDPNARPDSGMTIDEWRKYVAEQREFLIDIFKKNFTDNDGQPSSEREPISHDLSLSYEERIKAIDDFLSKIYFDDLKQSKILSAQSLDLSKSFHSLLEELGIADKHGNVQRTELKATKDITELEQSQLNNQQQKIEQVEAVSNNSQSRQLLAENKQSQQNLSNINNENPEQLTKALVGNERQIQGLQKSTDQLEKQAGIPIDPATQTILHDQAIKHPQEKNQTEKKTHEIPTEHFE